MSKPKAQPANHTKRRTLYGVNVAVSVVAVIAIVVLLNWLVAWAYERAAGSVKLKWLVHDLTATRAYQLSPQTRQLLDEVDGEVKITTLFRTRDLDANAAEQRRRVRDLVDEYARHTDKVDIETVDPYGSGIDALYDRVYADYADALAPVRDANAQAAATIADVAAAYERFADALTEAERDPGWGPRVAAAQRRGLSEPRELSELRRLRAAVVQEQRKLARAPELAEQAAAGRLPPVTEAYRLLADTLDTLPDQLDAYLASAAPLERDDDDVPADARRAIRPWVRAGDGELPALRRQTDAARGAMRAVTPPPGYAEVATRLRQGESVLVSSAGRHRVVPITELLQQIDADVSEQTGHAETRSFVEERLTGAVMSLGWDRPPAVVFVAAEPVYRVMGQAFRYVVSRLETPGFDVQWWVVSQRQAVPPPKFEDGRAVVWVVTPMRPAGNMWPPLELRIVEHLRARLTAGDGVVWLMATNPAFDFGVKDPRLPLMKAWGLTPRVDRMVLGTTAGPEGRDRATATHMVADWPAGSPITRPLRGMSGRLFPLSPVETEPVEGVSVQPLVWLREGPLWTDAYSRAAISGDGLLDAKVDPRTQRDAFVTAVAAARGDARMAVFTSPLWATDAYTAAGEIETPRGRVVVEDAGLRPGGQVLYPANAELFVNTVYWAAGMEQLIAASPRTQQVRRITVSDSTRTAFYIILGGGLPLAAAAGGVVVWFARRRY